VSDLEMMLAEMRTLRGEIHDWRREDKSEHVRMASEIGELQAWRNKQAGALALVGVVAGLIGAGVVRLVSVAMGIQQGGN